MPPSLSVRLTRAWYRLRAALSPAPIVILIQAGTPRQIRGKVPNALLRDFEDVLRSLPPKEGLITIRNPRHVPRFQVTGRFDPGTRQRLRNAWFALPNRPA